MQYILSEEEYKQIIPIEEHQKIRNELLDEIKRLENRVKELEDIINKIQYGNKEINP